MASTGKEAYPRRAALGGEAFQQVGQGAAAVDVEAVVGGVLRDEDEFLHAVGDQSLSLCHEVVDGARDVLAADEGDGAVGAGAVAALRDFEVGVVPGGGELTG